MTRAASLAALAAPFLGFAVGYALALAGIR